jgi:hypothetical protein
LCYCNADYFFDRLLAFVFNFLTRGLKMKYKKFFIFIFALILLGVMTIHGTAATLMWDPPDEGVPTGYVVYSREAGSTVAPYSVPLPVEVEEYPITADKYEPGKTYEFWVTAFNAAGESDPAGPLSHALDAFTPPTNPPPIVIVIPSTVTIRIE